MFDFAKIGTQPVSSEIGSIFRNTEAVPNSGILKENTLQKIANELERQEIYTYGQLMDAILKGANLTNKSLTKAVVNTVKTTLITLADNSISGIEKASVILSMLSYIEKEMKIQNASTHMSMFNQQSMSDTFTSVPTSTIPVFQPLINQTEIDIYKKFKAYLTDKKFPMNKLNKNQFIKQFAMFSSKNFESVGSQLPLEVEIGDLYERFKSSYSMI
ncbi:MAG: hypothetical protein ACRCX2_38925 [Paraclostridium sp.]